MGVLTCGWPVGVSRVGPRCYQPNCPLLGQIDRRSIWLLVAGSCRLYTVSVCLYHLYHLYHLQWISVICDSTFHPRVVFTIRRGKARRDKRRKAAPSLDARPIVRLISSVTVASVCISTNLQTERHVSIPFIPPSSTGPAHNGPFPGSRPVPLFACEATTIENRFDSQ